MLNRLFARNAPEDRVQDAIDHSKDAEQRDALRERSAVILDRLERKRAELRRIELEERQAAREAADRAALEAETTTEAAAAIEATATAETGMGAETAQADMGAVEATAPEAAAAETTAVGDLAAQAAETAQATGDYQPAPAYEETATAAEGYFSESEPLREPGAMEAETDYAAEGLTGTTAAPAADFGGITPEAAETDYPEAASEAPATGYEAGFAETTGYQPESTPPASTHSLAEEDPEVYEQIRRKAEEARARIAARLEQMQAGEGGETHQETEERLDLGEDAPPMYDDGEDQSD